MMTTCKKDSELSERARQVLKVLIDDYITGGQPVGSRTLAKRSGLQLSAATIRNVMSDLEDMGYIRAPHTSAGRIPTSHGYRFFVDALLQVRQLDVESVHTLQGALEKQRNSQALIESTSGLLSNITSLTGVVTLPRHSVSSIRQIEFLRLSSDQVLAILVLSDNEVQNRMIQLDKEMSSDELHQAANFLNECLVGKDIHLARQVLVEEMREHHAEMSRLMLSAIELGEMTFSGVDGDGDVKDQGYVIAGETNLMDYEDLSDLDKLRELFAAFTQKRELLALLDKTVQADGVQIFIGRESGFKVFDDCSVVTAPYYMEDEQLGVLGVIGPKRMPYERVIPLVDLTSKMLSVALKTQNST